MARNLMARRDSLRGHPGQDPNMKHHALTYLLLLATAVTVVGCGEQATDTQALHGENSEQVVESCERSLRRLRIETIDIYQFHGVVPRDYRRVVDQLYPTVERLREQGKIRFNGITEYFFADPAHEMLSMALQDDLWDTIMVKFGILNCSAERGVLPMAKQKSVGVLNMSAVRVKLTRPGELEKFIARWKDAGLISPDALPEKAPLDFLVHDGVKSVVAAGYKFGIEPEAISTLLVG
ncbi:MAG: aldo/keto reductase, partial [Proteobacteria bacterium]|nr:aldo/keto reductase [Pseudomonadota bacterium]